MEAVNCSTEEFNGLIFLCVDESVHAARALEWFHENFYREDHTVGIVHIHTPPVSQHVNRLADIETDYDTKVDEVMKKTSAVIQNYMDRCVEYGMKVKVFSREKTESVGRTICSLVKEHNPSCVVIGQRGLGAVKRTIYGSVSDYVLHHAHIPVVIVPPPKE